MSVVNIVIPVYKKPEQLEKCLEHLKEQDYGESNIILVDNNKVNNGFTKAVNAGLKKRDSNCEYAIILNQDCYLNKDAVTEMVKFMDNNPKCFLGGIKQVHSEDNDIIIHGGCLKAYPHGEHVGGRISEGHCSKDRQVPWVNGACMIVRCADIETVGLMDERYFLLGSDSDWAYTARQRGLEVWFIANAIAVHEQGISTESSNDEVQFIKDMDMIYFRDKHITGDEFRELEMEIF